MPHPSVGAPRSEGAARSSWARGPSVALVIAALCAGALHAWSGDIGLDLLDEGYLWYGVREVASGAVPLRDFQSYDPGRYYWAAAWSRLFGEGILSIRLAGTLFQILGLGCGLLAARRITRNPLWLAAIALVLLAWMFPRHKVFEPSLAMAGIWLGTRLLERPSAGRHFVSGLFVGLASFMGRNHGLYLAGAHLLLVGLVWLRGLQPTRRGASAWAAGLSIGLVPWGVQILLAPGFLAALLTSLTQFTPLPLPVPWPWRIGAASPGVWGVSLAFLLIVLAYPVGLFAVWRTPASALAQRALFTSCVCVGLFYAHQAFSRADAGHLAQGIHPLLLGLLAAPGAFGLSWRDPRALLALGLVVALTGLVTPRGQRPRFGPPPLVPFAAAGDPLRLPAYLAAELRAVEEVVRTRVGKEQRLAILPYRVGYYPLLGRRSPFWTLYFLRPGERESDADLIRKLDAPPVEWILYGSEALRGQSEGLKAVRPRFFAYIRRHFAQVHAAGLPPTHRLLRRAK